jgi:hypothetical protein
MAPFPGNKRADLDAAGAEHHWAVRSLGASLGWWLYLLVRMRHPWPKFLSAAPAGQVMLALIGQAQPNRRSLTAG